MQQTFRTLTAVCITLLSVATAKIEAATIYVGLGGQHGISTNNGALGTLNPATGAVTVIGTPAGVTAISGLTFTSNGNLWGSTQNGGGMFPPPGPNTTSNLIQINPQTRSADLQRFDRNSRWHTGKHRRSSNPAGYEHDLWDSKPQRRELYWHG